MKIDTAKATKKWKKIETLSIPIDLSVYFLIPPTHFGFENTWSSVEMIFIKIENGKIYFQFSIFHFFIRKKVKNQISIGIHF